MNKLHLCFLFSAVTLLFCYILFYLPGSHELAQMIFG